MDYREEIIRLLDIMQNENTLLFILIIVADIALEQGIISEVPYEAES